MNPRARFGRNLVAGALTLGAFVAPFAGAQVKEEWRVPTYANRLVLDPDNNICVDGTGPDADFIAEKYNPEGDLLWSTTFGHPTINEHVNWLAADSQGAMILTGHKHGATGGLMTVKFSASGDVLWSDIQNVGSGEAYRVEVDAADNVYVVGVTFDDHDNYDYYTVKYAPDGTILWIRQKTFGVGSFDSPRSLAVSPDGTVAVTGQVGSNDFGTVVYDTAGNEVFAAVYLDGKSGASDVVLAPDGSVFVSGMGIQNLAVVVAYDAAGNEMWDLEITDPDIWWGKFNKVTLDSAGNVVAAGYANAPNSSFMDWLVAKIDPLGNLQWYRTHGTYETWDEWALAVTTGPQDEVYVAGAAGTPGCSGGRGIGTAIFRYDADGAVDWFHEAACSGAWSNSIALDSFGEVVLDTGPGEIIRLLQQDWMTLGFALAGTNGDPVLDIQGYLQLDEFVQLNLSNALPFSFGWHVIGLSRWDVPLAGGTLVPAWDLPVRFRVDGAGQAMASTWINQSLPRPFELYVQSWFIDPGAPQGLASSNAVTKALQ